MTLPLSWSMRFALALCAVFVFAALTAGGIAYVLQSRELAQRLASDVRTTAEGLARIAEDGDRQDLVEQIDAQSLASRDGATLVAFVEGNTGEMIGNLSVTAPFVGARRLTAGRDLELEGRRKQDASKVYYAYGIRTSLGWVMAARDEAWIIESREVLLQTSAWALGAASLISIALAVLVARRNARRVVAMERVLDAVATGHFDRRIRDRSYDDLAQLASSVDRTLDRLEAGIGAIRQVSTDVAHDLRAPLARLRLRLEPHALDPDLAPATRREIGSALADLDAISASFDAILRLARLQSGSFERREDDVDLVALATEAHSILEASAEETGHELALDLQGAPVVVRGDGELISQALVNLVDNALRHCPPPAHIAISVQMKGGLPTLSVCDDGPGIAPEDRARAVERFVRLDRSRTTPGTGLGLSLVAAIAELHGAELRLDDNRPGLCASLMFPRDQRLAGPPERQRFGSARSA